MRAQKIGILGKTLEIPAAIEHSLAYLPLISPTPSPDLPPSEECVDLGSGAGLPGLVLALIDSENSHRHWTLCDRSQKRVDFLKWAVQSLNLEVEVIKKSAERLENIYHTITVRALAKPPIVVECVARLLNIGGKAIVGDMDDPTGQNEKRWDRAKINKLGLSLDFVSDPFQFVILEKVSSSETRARSWKQMTAEPIWEI